MRSLAQMMRVFKQAGVIQLVAEHRLAYLSELVDRVIFMRAGRIDESFSGERLRSMSDKELNRMGLRSIRTLSTPTCARQLVNRSSPQQKTIKKPAGSVGYRFRRLVHRNAGNDTCPSLGSIP